ncbi:MAG: hypothetical protein ACK5C8_10415, partial [Roseiflexaceae bacterium]
MTLTLFRHAMTAFHHVGASFHGAPTNISALAVEKIPRRRRRHGMTPRGGPRHAVTVPACWAPMLHTLFRHAMTAFHHVGASFHGAPTNISAFAVEKIPRRHLPPGKEAPIPWSCLDATGA